MQWSVVLCLVVAVVTIYLYSGVSTKQLRGARLGSLPGQTYINPRYSDACALCPQTRNCDSYRPGIDPRPLFPGLFKTSDEIKIKFFTPEVAAGKVPNIRLTERIETNYTEIRSIGVSNIITGCCETEIRQTTYNQAPIENNLYQVVNFGQAYQYVPVGVCRDGTTCSVGRCIQMARFHWLLIWNHTSAQLTFAPIEVPSHCECSNVG